MSFGESHGSAVGGVIDGCPAGIALSADFIQGELNRRRPGQSEVSTPRKEEDTVEILSGIFEGKSTGMPIGFLVRNQNQNSKDYNHLKDLYRPSHADYTWEKKYGIRDYRGGGRSSAREHIARVVAGAVAKQVLAGYGISKKVLINSSSWWLYGRLVIKTPLTKVVHVLSREQQMGQPNLLAAKDMSAVGLRKQNNRKTMEMK